MTKSTDLERMSDEICGTCFYYSGGCCLRYPPVPGENGDRYTPVSVDTWCGEWKELKVKGK